MKTPLEKIEILSIYKKNGARVVLPQKMAKATPDTRNAIYGISKDLSTAGGNLVLSDLFRSYDMQLQAHLDYETGKKQAYSPPPGGSMHEAGRAFDLSLEDMKISLADFWEIAKAWGVFPIISTPNMREKESWHFDCRGSHDIVYDYYKSGKGNNFKPYKAMAVSAILATGIQVDDFNEHQPAAYLQSCLVRLGYELGNIDGMIGRKTKAAVKDAGINSENIDEIIPLVENLLKEKYPREF